MLLFSVHPEPEGRKVKRMNFVTLKELKKMVPAVEEGKRPPSLKKILEEGTEVVLRKLMENHAEVVVYKNGYVSYQAHERSTVFPIHDCKHYHYESQGNEQQTIPHDHFEDMEWHIRLVIEGEDRLAHNTSSRESEVFSYSEDTGSMKIIFPAVPKSNGSNTEKINKTDNSETDLIYPAELQEEEQYRRYFKEVLELEILEQGYPADKAVLYEILELLVETVTSRKKFLRICGEEKPKEVVKSRLMKLNSSHIQYILECLKENSTQIRNIKQYLLATLYNAPVTVDSYYSAQVRHEFGWSGRVDKN